MNRISNQVSSFLGGVEADLHFGVTMREEIKVNESVFNGFQETITSPNSGISVVLIHPDDETSEESPE